MPIEPSTYRTNFPLTAHQLNQDMYTYDGSYFNSNGVAFHSNRPLMYESYQIPSILAAKAGGSFTILGGTQGDAISVVDNAALFGSGSDYPGEFATFWSDGAIAPGSAGQAFAYGGWSLFFSFIPIGPFSGTSNTYGVVWNTGTSRKTLGLSPLTDIGCMQAGSTTRNNCGFAVDLLPRNTTNPTATFAPTVFLTDPASQNNAVVANTLSTTGQTPRFGEIWMGVSNGNGTTVTSIPTPIPSIGTATTLTAATLNTTIQQTFNLLNNPPMLNVEQGGGGAVTANALTTVPFTVTPIIDNYSKFSTSATHYIVPLSGVYFLHANIIFETSWNVGSGYVGFSVNTTVINGGSYNATPVGAQNTAISATKVLDLNAGDTVSVFANVSVTNAFGTANISHFIMNWLAPLNTSTQSWTPPNVTGFQFQAGNPPGVTTTTNPTASGSATSPGTFQVLATLNVPAGVYSVNWSATLAGTLGAGDANNFAVRVQSGPTVEQSNNAGAAGTYPQAAFTVTGPVTLQLETFSSTPTSGSTYSGTVTAVSAAQQQSGLVSIMNSKIANDVNFLLNRPYCMVHQTSAQSSLAQTTWTNITMQSTVGQVHGSLGDNYAGWNVGANHYVAPVAGWYLAVAELNAATTSTANSHFSLICGFSVPTSGGFTSPTSSGSGGGSAPPDWYQDMLVSNTWTYPTGATGIGLYYLLPGETIAPVAQYVGATWGTDVSHNFASHFNVIWLSN